MNPPKVALQFWVLDTEATEELKEDWISKLLSMDDAPSASATPVKRGKRKGKNNKKAKAKAKAKAQVSEMPQPLYNPKPSTLIRLKTCDAGGEKTLSPINPFSDLSNPKP